jgi:hypothetical protein
MNDMAYVNTVKVQISRVKEVKVRCQSSYLCKVEVSKWAETAANDNSMGIGIARKVR